MKKFINLAFLIFILNLSCGNPCGTCPKNGVPLSFIILLSSSAPLGANNSSCKFTTHCIEKENISDDKINKDLCIFNGADYRYELCSNNNAIGKCKIEGDNSTFNKIYNNSISRNDAINDCNSNLKGIWVEI
ncbi:hypothetical protein [Leptospira vanthielii]|uniref:hypothetical protein n=1 Tax=Leptospira vanthielii TaxID=293085 RepID=UPI0005870653|nr:hypothetical protein [Leptospira vanthielii]